MTLEKRRQHLVQLSAAMAGRAKTADTDQDVSRVGVHPGQSADRHESA
jgi:hypothetical protein